MGNKIRTIGNPLEVRGSNIDQRVFDYYNKDGRLMVIVDKGRTRLKIWTPTGNFANIPIKHFFDDTTLDLDFDQDQLNFILDVLEVVKQQDEVMVFTEPEARYSYYGLTGRYILSENEVQDSVTLSIPQINLTVPSHDIEILQQAVNFLERGQVRTFIEMVMESGRKKKDELRDEEDGVNESDVTEPEGKRSKESDVTGPDKSIGFMPATKDQTHFDYFATNGRHYSANVNKREQYIDLKEFPGSRYRIPLKEMFDAKNEVMEKLGNDVACWLMKAVVLADRGGDLFVSDEAKHNDYSYAGLLGIYSLRLMLDGSEQVAVTLPSIKAIVEKENLPQLRSFLSWIEQGQLVNFITRKLADDAD